MNKILKIIIAILGGVNTAFSIIIPMFIAFLVIQTYPLLGNINQQIILLAGFLSSLYRGVKVWI